jgi:SAM-dependent methyltransferase
MVPRESASFDAEAPWRRELNRGAAFGFGRNYSHRNGRSYDLLNDYRTQLQGRILDVGAGDQATFFREKIGNNYESLDIGDGYKIVTRNERDAISHVYNLEGRPLPFDDKSFDCVMCMDTLEHVDDPHLLLGELLRVSSKHVIVSLPNNWPRLIWSLIYGRDITHAAGYGLGAKRKSPGQRHKHFFNLEEAAEFLAGNRGSDYDVSFKFRFEHGQDGFVASAPLLTRFYRQLGKATRKDAAERFGKSAALPAYAAIKIAYGLLRMIDWPFTAALWGFGDPVRYYNTCSRQVWVLYSRRGR